MITRWLLLTALFIVPVVLLYAKIIPFRHKIRTLTVVALIVSGIVLVEKWDLNKLGLSTDAFLKNWPIYLVFTAALSVAIIILVKSLNKEGQADWLRDSHFLYGFILISALQELVFRGFLIPELRALISSTLLVIFVNAILFTFMHVIYASSKKELVGIYLGGMGFATMYVYFPSLILVILSHAVLNFLVVYYGLFSQERLSQAAPGLRGD